MKSTLATFLSLNTPTEESYFSWARFTRMGKVKKNNFLKDF